MKGKEPDILEMLMRHELALKQLYELFAAMFPNRQDFWQHIAEDEQRHSNWLETLRSEETLEDWYLSDSQLRPQAIQSSISYVEVQIARAREGNFSLLEALSVSKDLESAMLERQFAKISNLVHEKIRSVLLDLAAETERHRRAIVEALDAEKRAV
jgi:rubrerythrin